MGGGRRRTGGRGGVLAPAAAATTHSAADSWEDMDWEERPVANLAVPKRAAEGPMGLPHDGKRPALGAGTQGAPGGGRYVPPSARLGEAPGSGFPRGHAHDFPRGGMGAMGGNGPGNSFHGGGPKRGKPTFEENVFRCMACGKDSSGEISFVQVRASRRRRRTASRARLSASRGGRAP